MKNEFQENKYEQNNSNLEIPEYSEIKIAQEISDFSENLMVESEEEKTAKPKKKSSDISMFSKMASLVAITAAATTIVIPTTTETKVFVEFRDTVVTDTTVQYAVAIELLEDKAMDVYLKVSNDFTKRTYGLEIGYNSDTIENLKPNMSYSLEVVTKTSFGEKVLANTAVRTLSEDAWRTSKFNGVTTECRCEEDGFFYFTMDFVDNLERFVEFTAYLEDEYNNTSQCYFTQNFHEEQKIMVTGSSLQGSTVKFVIICEVRDENDNIEREIMYEAIVSI